MAGPGRAVSFELHERGFRYPCRVHWHPSDRTPVCFVSGAFQSMASWRRFADHFGRERTVVLCDLPGTGEADRLPATFGLDFLAVALARVVRTLGLPRVHVVSASYGSPIAYRFAQLFPSSTGRLVLAGVMKEIPRHLRATTRATLDALASGDRVAFAQRVVDGLLCTDPRRHVERRALARRLLVGQLERMDPVAQAKYVENTTRLLDHPALDLDRAPAVPALVFTGEHDVYTRPADCLEVASAFDDATFTTIANADHLFHVERFDATLALLDDFIGRDAERSGRQQTGVGIGSAGVCQAGA